MSWRPSRVTCPRHFSSVLDSEKTAQERRRTLSSGHPSQGHHSEDAARASYFRGLGSLKTTQSYKLTSLHLSGPVCFPCGVSVFLELDDALLEEPTTSPIFNNEYHQEARRQVYAESLVFRTTPFYASKVRTQRHGRVLLGG